MLLLYYRSPAPPMLLSFPTRRSSDLWILRLPGSVLAQDVQPSIVGVADLRHQPVRPEHRRQKLHHRSKPIGHRRRERAPRDRKSTRLNSSHANISYAVFCLKKKTHTT